MQKPKSKIQNEKEKFKKEFITRLVNFSIRVIKLTQRMKEQRLPWAIIDQLIRSATSIGANVVEAKGSTSKKDYRRFFEIALKSANETKYWLILIKQSYPEFTEQAQQLLKEADEISKIIGASVLTLKGRR